jgi:hypothetical protein
MRFSSLPLLLVILGLSSFAAPSLAEACTPDSTTLCLNQARFQVSVSWKDFAGGTGVGQAANLTDDTGAFWFFSAENLELVVKVLDGRDVNNAFWVFYGALSNVEYSIRITDVETGATKSYVNPSGTLASLGDTNAFPGSSEVAGRFFYADRTAFPTAADDFKASFTCTPNPAEINSDVTCIDTSGTDPDLRCWNFGDGTGPCVTSSLVATHRFTIARTYQVSLLLRRFDNQTATESKAYRNVIITEATEEPCSYSFFYSSTPFDSAGGLGEIKVMAKSGCKWNATVANNSSSFLSIVSGASGSGNGQVQYKVLKNEGRAERRGTLTVAGKSFEVKQKGAPCSYSLSADILNFDDLGGVGSLTIATYSDCSWKLTSDSPFLQAAGTGSGKGTATVTFCVAANRGAERAAGFSLGGANLLSLTQSASPDTPSTACSSGAETACLLDHFEARLAFRDSDGQNQAGKPVTLTPQSAYFTFFNSSNIELMMKLLDGREVNGHYWFFYGSLSNIAYAVTLTDTETGDFQLYCNASGTFRSVGDTNALPTQ